MDLILSTGLVIGPMAITLSYATIKLYRGLSWH
jgi:hypothetical protein